MNNDNKKKNIKLPDFELKSKEGDLGQHRDRMKRREVGGGRGRGRGRGGGGGGGWCVWLRIDRAPTETTPRDTNSRIPCRHP
ncbi:hypothetical protein M0804_004900 [Polistes exclamans]|nr:hypothetical protein M0804_004900 [Polistes exclamans]